MENSFSYALFILCRFVLCLCSKRRQNLIYRLLLHLPNRNHLRRYVLIWQQRFLIPGNIVPFSALITGIFAHAHRPESASVMHRIALHIRTCHQTVDCLPMPFDVTRLSRYSESSAFQRYAARSSCLCPYA